MSDRDWVNQKIMSALRSCYPAGCDLCDHRVVAIAFSASKKSPRSGFCATCLAKHAFNGDQWAKDEIVRRSVWRYLKRDYTVSQSEGDAS